MPTAWPESIAEGKIKVSIIKLTAVKCLLNHPTGLMGMSDCCRNYWEFRRHFPDLADTLYASLDSATQRALERERDGTESNGTNSMSASLRGSNSSLNSMPNSVISMCPFVFMSNLVRFRYLWYLSKPKIVCPCYVYFICRATTSIKLAKSSYC